MKLSEDTDIAFDVQYSNRERAFDAGLIAVGNRVIDVPRDRILNEPDDFIERTFVSTGYSLEQRFNNRWTLRNAFRYATTKVFSNKLTIPTAFDETTGILDRVYAFNEFYSDDYALQTNAVGKFATGSVKHTLLFGVDLNRTDSNTFSFFRFLQPNIIGCLQSCLSHHSSNVSRRFAYRQEIYDK